MQVMGKAELIDIRFTSDEEQRNCSKSYKAEGYLLVKDYFLGDVPCSQFKKILAGTIQMTVREYVTETACTHVVVKDSFDEVIYYGDKNVFLSETSLVTARLLKSAVKSASQDCEVLTVYIEV